MIPIVANFGSKTQFCLFSYKLLAGAQAVTITHRAQLDEINHIYQARKCLNKPTKFIVKRLDHFGKFNGEFCELVSVTSMEGPYRGGTH